MIPTDKLSKFYEKASDREKELVDNALKDKKESIALTVIEQVLGESSSLSEEQLLNEVPTAPDQEVINEVPTQQKSNKTFEFGTTWI